MEVSPNLTAALRIIGETLGTPARAQSRRETTKSTCGGTRTRTSRCPERRSRSGNCVISGNRRTSANGDGGIYSFGNPVFILTSAITGNSTSDLGGGIYNASATMTFDSVSSVTENTALNGGGIYNDGGTVTLNGATVSGNSVSQCVGVVCPGT